MMSDVEEEILRFINDYECSEKIPMEDMYNIIVRNPTKYNIIKKIAEKSYCLSIDLYLEYEIKSKKVTHSQVYGFHNRCRNFPNFNVLIPVTIIYKDISKSHSTALLIDNNHKEIIYYDSSGTETYWYDPIYKFLKEEMEKHYEGYQFGSLNDSCPIALNNQGSGICAAYTIFIYWVLIKYPQMEVWSIPLFLENIPELERYKFMFKFICYIYDFMVENKISIYDYPEAYGMIGLYEANLMYLKMISRFFYRIKQKDLNKSNDKISELFNKVKEYNKNHRENEVYVDEEMLLLWLKNTLTLNQLFEIHVNHQKTTGDDLTNAWFNDEKKLSKWFDEHKGYGKELNYENIFRWFMENESYFFYKDSKELYKLRDFLISIREKYLPEY